MVTTGAMPLVDLCVVGTVLRGELLSHLLDFCVGHGIGPTEPRLESSSCRISHASALSLLESGEQHYNNNNNK